MARLKVSHESWPPDRGLDLVSARGLEFGVSQPGFAEEGIGDGREDGATVSVEAPTEQWQRVPRRARETCAQARKKRQP